MTNTLGFIHENPDPNQAKRIYRYEVPDFGGCGFLCVQTDIYEQSASFPAMRPFVQLQADGVLWIRTGYSWDGATLFPDFKWIIWPSLVHDALYQLMRKGLLGHCYRVNADRLLRRMCRAYGSGRTWSNLVYAGTRTFGGAFSGH